uniref:Uncharacterized protein n=1 Tax=Oryza barthii TaxID=65489 RepID=A0A0D3H1E0_9ORYZ
MVTAGRIQSRRRWIPPPPRTDLVWGELAAVAALRSPRLAENSSGCQLLWQPDALKTATAARSSWRRWWQRPDSDEVAGHWQQRLLWLRREEARWW